MTTAATYRFFDHTGDYGVDVDAPDAGAAYDAVAQAFAALLTDAPGCVARAEARALEVTGVDAAATLVAFGNELLYLFEAEGFLGAGFAATSVAPGRVTGDLWGAPFDPARHPIARPAKAVTHHAAAFDEDPRTGRVRARLIFDL